MSQMKENMSESNESCETYVSNGSSFYSETDENDVSSEGDGNAIVGLFHNEPGYGEKEIKKEN